MAGSWQVRMRRDTAAQWTSKNPILQVEEVGLESDTKKFKIGNGTTPWSLLPYSNVSGTSGILVFVSSDAGNKLTYGSDGGLYVP